MSRLPIATVEAWHDILGRLPSAAAILLLLICVARALHSLVVRCLEYRVCTSGKPSVVCSDS